MKIAVTADVHLVPGSDGHPERLAALRDILGRLPGLGGEQLIIAGDLFDRAPQGYGEFDALCEQHPAVTIDVIPGNHAASLRKWQHGAAADGELPRPVGQQRRRGHLLRRVLPELEPGAVLGVGVVDEQVQPGARRRGGAAGQERRQQPERGGAHH